MVMFPPPTPDEGPPVSYDALARRRSAGENTLGDVIPQLLGAGPPPTYGADIQRASDYTRMLAANTPEPVDKAAAERSYLRALGTDAPPPVAPPPSQEMIRAHQAGAAVPSGTGDSAESGNANPAAIRAHKSGVTVTRLPSAALDRGAYHDAPRPEPTSGLWDTPSGYQQEHDRGVEETRNQYYDDVRKRIEENARLYDPQRRNLEAESLNAAYESLMPAARPAGEQPFTQDPTTGAWRNNPAPPRINRSANAQQLDLASGMAGIEMGKEGARRGAFSEDANRITSSYTAKKAEYMANPLLNKQKLENLEADYMRAMSQLIDEHNLGAGRAINKPPV